MRSEEIRQLTGRYVMNTYGRLPLAIVRGKGTRLWDADGREYLDFVTGLAVDSLGHCHPRVVSAIQQQAETLLHCSNLYHIEPQARLARWLVEHSPFERAFFCNSGTEANEAAIKMARKLARRRGEANRAVIVSARNSFHGRTLGSLAATGQAKYHGGFEPLPGGFVHVPFNDPAALEEAVGPTTAAVLLEPVQGEGGVWPADPEYLRTARRLCDERGALLVFDEVQTGLGRTGRLFAFEHSGVVPDAVTLAKALGGGVPIGALLARGEAAQALQPGDHASTFGGNPLATAAALAAMEALEEEGLVKAAEATGAYLLGRLESLAARHPSVVEVRGLGLMIGLQLKGPAQGVLEGCLRRGLLVNVCAGSVLRLLPPLNVSQAEVDRALEVLDEALAELEESMELGA